jgi:hypothetical protein
LGRWKAWQARLPAMEEVAEQWEAVPRANVGVVLGAVSGLVGVDADGPEGGPRLLQEAGGLGEPSGKVPKSSAFGRSSSR